MKSPKTIRIENPADTSPVIAADVLQAVIMSIDV